MDAKAYMTKLAQAPGLDAETKAALLKAADDADVAKMVAEDTMLRSDYSRSKDELDKQMKTNVDYYNKLVATEDHNTKLISTYKERYGEITDDGSKKPLVATGADVITKKEHEDSMNRMGQQSIQVTKVAMWASSDYMHRFGKVLDPDALEKHALEKGMPLRQAYDDFIKPLVTEQDTKKNAEAIELAKAEAVRDYASKNKLPVDSTKEATPFLSNVLKSNDANKAATSTSAKDGFVEAWNNFTPARAGATANK